MNWEHSLGGSSDTLPTPSRAGIGLQPIGKGVDSFQRLTCVRAGVRETCADVPPCASAQYVGRVSRACESFITVHTLTKERIAIADAASGGKGAADFEIPPFPV